MIHQTTARPKFDMEHTFSNCAWSPGSAKTQRISISPSSVPSCSVPDYAFIVSSLPDLLNPYEPRCSGRRLQALLIGLQALQHWDDNWGNFISSQLQTHTHLWHVSQDIWPEKGQCWFWVPQLIRHTGVSNTCFLVLFQERYIGPWMK